MDLDLRDFFNRVSYSSEPVHSRAALDVCVFSEHSLELEVELGMRRCCECNFAPAKCIVRANTGL